MERNYVAIDLHRRRSLILRQNEHGEELAVVRIDNDPVALAAALAEAGPDPEVAIEATYVVVLGGRRAPGRGRQRALGEPVGTALGHPTGQERL